MGYDLPFPNGHSPSLDFDRVLKKPLTGNIDITLKGKKVTFKGVSEVDILEIRGILLKEVRRQNER